MINTVVVMKCDKCTRTFGMGSEGTVLVAAGVPKLVRQLVMWAKAQQWKCDGDKHVCPTCWTEDEW